MLLPRWLLGSGDEGATAIVAGGDPVSIALLVRCGSARRYSARTTPNARSTGVSAVYAVVTSWPAERAPYLAPTVAPSCPVWPWMVDNSLLILLWSAVTARPLGVGYHCCSSRTRLGAFLANVLTPTAIRRWDHAGK